MQTQSQPKKDSYLADLVTERDGIFIRYAELFLATDEFGGIDLGDKRVTEDATRQILKKLPNAAEFVSCSINEVDQEQLNVVYKDAHGRLDTAMLLIYGRT